MLFHQSLGIQVIIYPFKYNKSKKPVVIENSKQHSSGTHSYLPILRIRMRASGGISSGSSSSSKLNAAATALDCDLTALLC